MLKLAEEYPAIKKTMIDFAYNPSRGREVFIADYLGEGMSSIWTDHSLIRTGAKTLSYENIKQVIIEEPEMGLHPRAIRSFMYIVMELLYRGYSVVLSTHSPAVLEIAWALGLIGEGADPVSSFCKLFGAAKKSPMEDMAQSVLKKSIKVHYFKPGEDGKTRTVDISGMDPSGMEDEADWGGLTEQSSLAGAIVAESA
jgi:hypothetical protein